MENARQYRYEMKHLYEARAKELCTRLEIARGEAQLTQEAVAIAIGRSQAFMSRIKTGRLAISVPELVEMAALYRKPLNYFFDGWCTVGWTATNEDVRYSAEAARTWEMEARMRRKRNRRKVKKIYRPSGF